MNRLYTLEPLLVGGYAILLILIALLLESLARHSQRRSAQYETGGFRFHRDRDIWVCPQGASLERKEIDHGLRVIQYRAPADQCNACSIKSHCTSSDRGRTISMPLDPWVRSATERFQRGISLVLVVLAAVMLSVELFRHGRGPAGWVLAVLLVGIATYGLNLASRMHERSSGHVWEAGVTSRQY